MNPFSRNFGASKVALTLDRANGRGGSGSQTAADPPKRPSENPEKQTVGTMTASHKILTLQALSSSLNAGTAKRGSSSRGKTFESPPAVCHPEWPRPFAPYRLTKARLLKRDLPAHGKQSENEQQLCRHCILGSPANFLRELCRNTPAQIWHNLCTFLDAPAYVSHKISGTSSGRTPRGSCNNTLFRRVLRRFFSGSASTRVLRRRLVRFQ